MVAVRKIKKIKKKNNINNSIISSNYRNNTYSNDDNIHNITPLFFGRFFDDVSLHTKSISNFIYLCGNWL